MHRPGRVGRKPLKHAAEGLIELACVCGELIRLSKEAAKYLCNCPSCPRKFFINLSNAGVATPVYVADAVRPAPAPASRSGAAAKPRPTPGDETSLSLQTVKTKPENRLPQPPESLNFSCGCGQKLVAKKEMYDKRVRCPRCSNRLILTLVYDSGSDRFEIRHLSAPGPSEGDTHILNRIP